MVLIAEKHHYHIGMRKLLSTILFASLVGCSSTQDRAKSRTYADPVYSGQHENIFCSYDVGCAMLYILVYGTASVVRLIQNTKFTSPASESVDGGIVLNCYIQSPDRSFLYPCGPFTVDVIEKKTNKSRSYTFTGDYNQIGFVKGKNRITVRINECGLIQHADEVKGGDIIKLEFPATCKLAKH